MKTNFSNLQVLLGDDPEVTKVLKKYRLYLKKLKNPRVYVRAHTRKWPVKRNKTTEMYFDMKTFSITSRPKKRAA